MMKNNYTYNGLIVPVFTPFNNDVNRSLNLSIIPQYAKFLHLKNITGILVNGSTGEGTSLTFIERKKVAEAWATAVQNTKQHLMIQVGGMPLQDVKELAKHAESLNADAILCLPELYFKPNNVHDLIEYLKLVGESAPKTPLFYYDYPRASNVNVDLGQLFTLINQKVPTFTGVKTDLERGLIARQANQNFKIFLAGDMLMLAGCAMGFDSYLMTSINFIPESAFEVIKFCKGNNDLSNARKNQEFINEVIKEVTRYGTWVECMKVAMNLNTNIFMGPPRAPLKYLTFENVQAMNKNLYKLGLKTNMETLTRMH